MLILFTGCTAESAATPILIRLPTATATPTSTATSTPTATPTITLTPSVTAPATQTPTPYLVVELTIRDVETGEAARGTVLLTLFVDGKELSYPLERNVSDMSVELPRDIMRADAVYLTVTAPGYLDNSVILPPEAKTEPRISLEALLGKTSR